MENLKVRFLSEPPKQNINNERQGGMKPFQNMSNKETQINNDYYQNYINMGTESSVPQKAIPNFKPINLQPYVSQNRPLEDMNINMNYNEEGKFDEYNNANRGNRNINMNYYNNTNSGNNDTHANLKYYYPEEYNSMYENENRENRENNNEGFAEGNTWKPQQPNLNQGNMYQISGASPYAAKTQPRY